MLSTRKRPKPTAEELEQRKQDKLQIKCKQVALSSLRHKIMTLYDHGCFMENWQFPPKSSKKIIEYLQSTHAKYAKHAAAKSFFYRALNRHKLAAAGETPHLDPHRDRRGENRRKTKRENPQIVAICDEMLSEKKATAPKVRQQIFIQLLMRVSDSTIYRIGGDLFFHWTKPWYTDVLTPAQKFKRYLFCEENLQLTEEELLRKIAAWLFSDEKWWDIVGPEMSAYVKAATKTEAKKQMMVNSIIFFA